ncbi:MAG: glycosyltransferase family 2 protein [Candidatus Methanofastidiosia archaeon]|jgi:glycosyltransferase involved in cell wall biosynthesis
MKILVIIPAYNEEETIGEVVQKVKQYLTPGLIQKIVVIDDCSQDKTAEIAAQLHVFIVSHTINRGYGAAQRTGYALAIKEGFDYVLQLDADGQHDPQYIPSFIETIKKGDYDLVIGSRFLNASYTEYILTRRMGIKFFTLLVNFLGSTQLTDVTSGYKMYKVSSLKKLTRSTDKHPAVEQMLEISRKNMKIKEISIEMPLREKGESHLTLKNYLLYPLRVLECIFTVLLFRKN